MGSDAQRRGRDLPLGADKTASAQKLHNSYAAFCTGNTQTLSHKRMEQNMGQFIVRGIPPSVLKDSWWLDTPEPTPNRSNDASGHDNRQAVGALIILVALADLLLLDYLPGISLAVFTLAVAGAAWLLSGRRKGQVGPVVLLGLSIFPVVEYAQALSVAFLLGGSTVAFCWSMRGRCEGSSVRRFLEQYPVLAIRQMIEAARHAPTASDTKSVAQHIWRNWGFPVGGGLVLGGLMISANPVLFEWTEHMLNFDIRIDRIVFWIGVAMMVWPVLAVAVQPGLLSPRAGPNRKRTRPGFGLNARSVANALILFNALLAVQTGMDALFLWGNAELPEGMSHAEYAHRGAYPLLATALLAGAFALAARPFLKERHGLTGLMMFWLGQNVLLVLSSLFRLSLYVDAYGLTYLRVHAAIWMGLVAVGLCLTAWQILKDKPNRWLMTRTAALGIGVLYACCFVNFAAVIARENLRHPHRYDAYYTCQLGPMAAAEIAAAPRPAGCRPDAPQIANWREWGFRADRVIRNLNTELQPEAGHENPRRG